MWINRELITQPRTKQNMAERSAYLMEHTVYHPITLYLANKSWSNKSCFQWLSQNRLRVWWDMMTLSNRNIFRVTGPLCGEFTGHPSQKPVTWNFDVFFHLCLNKRLSNQSWGWWFETPPCSLWRHFNTLLYLRIFTISHQIRRRLCFIVS